MTSPCFGKRSEIDLNKINHDDVALEESQLSEISYFLKDYHEKIEDLEEKKLKIKYRVHKYKKQA